MWRLESLCVSKWSDLKLFDSLLRAFKSAQLGFVLWFILHPELQSKIRHGLGHLLFGVLSQQGLRYKNILYYPDSRCLPEFLAGQKQRDHIWCLYNTPKFWTIHSVWIPLDIYACMFSLHICLYVIDREWSSAQSLLK